MKKLFVSILIILSLALISLSVSADVGPKPSVKINVLYNESEITDISFSAKMLTCSYEMKYEEIISVLAQYEDTQEWHSECQRTASDYGFDRGICYGELQDQRGMTNLSAKRFCRQGNITNCEKLIIKIPDEERGCYWAPAFLAWGGDCHESKCYFGYMPPSKFKLLVYIPSLNKTFLSDEVSRTKFNSQYEINLNPDGTAKIHETILPIRKDNFYPFFRALIFTIIIETLFAFLYLTKNKLSKRILISVVLGTLVTLPFVWFIFPLIGAIFFVIIASEFFAIAFEAIIIYLLNKKRIGLKNSFILSIVINLASLIIGGLFFLFIAYF